LSATLLPPAPHLEARSITDASKSNRAIAVAIVLDFVAIGLSIVGICLWLPSFLPNIHIDHRGPIDAHRPFFTPFPVTNDGLSSVYEVYWLCRMNSMIFADGTKVTPNDSSGFLTHRLDRAGTVDLFCPEPVIPNNPLKFADIVVGIAFTPRLLHRQLGKCAHFVTHVSGDNIDWKQVIEDDANCADIMKDQFQSGPLNLQPLFSK
jgi:hypothetical protein